LSANFTVRELRGVNVRVGVASLHLANEVADCLAFQRTYQIRAGYRSANDASPYRDAEFLGTEQRDDDGTVRASASKMNMTLPYAADIINDELEG